MESFPSGSGSTYVSSSGNVFDVVLGATARRDMAEVQLFVHYLHLKRERKIRSLNPPIVYV